MTALVFKKEINEAVKVCLSICQEFIWAGRVCDFGPTKDEQICDHIVIRIADSDGSEKLQLEPDLTLEKAIQITD